MDPIFIRETNLVDICDQLEETFTAQPAGVQNFCSVRYTTIRASLFRLCPARWLYCTAHAVFILYSVADPDPLGSRR